MEPRWETHVLCFEPRRGLGHLLTAGGRFEAAGSIVEASLRPNPIFYRQRRDSFFYEYHPTTGGDIWSLAPDGTAAAVRATPFNEFEPVVSPDGRWVAYESNKSGRYEVYIQDYPGGEKRIPISTGGGEYPRWSRDGKELFYFAGDAMMAVSIRPDGSIFSVPHRLFDISNYAGYYDVSPDGKRFLMIRLDPGSVPNQLNVILDWFDELRRLAPPATK
jgi:hypothetical protein